MTASDQTRGTALVTGASRGFGRAIASALHAHAAAVVAVARSAEPLASLRDELNGAITTVVADVGDPVVDVDEYFAHFGQPLTPEDVGKATVDVVTSAQYAPGAYLLTPDGLTAVG